MLSRLWRINETSFWVPRTTSCTVPCIGDPPPEHHNAVWGFSKCVKVDIDIVEADSNGKIPPGRAIGLAGGEQSQFIMAELKGLWKL